MNAALRLILLFALMNGCVACRSLVGDPVLRLTLHVVDDEGQPVEGVSVSFGGEGRPKPSGSSTGVALNGQTDALGLFSGELEVWDATLAGYSAEKTGYYPVKQHSYSSKRAVRGKWQPWNPTIEVVLKRKKNPVPMYAKRVRVEVPVSGVDVGYDLQIGDWVAPYGEGRLADMIFHSEGEVKDDRNYRGELTVTFPGRGNGLIPFEIAKPKLSPLRMPYEAPPEGYQAQRTWRSVRRYNPKTMENEEYINDSSETQNFFLRVRSEWDAEGKVVKAMYGKIHAPFDFDARGIDPWGRTKQSVINRCRY